MSIHTPGPWRIETANDYKGMAVTYGPNGLLICEMEWDDTEPFESDWHDQTKADAQLIAAAPDLLAACKLALERHALDHNGFVKQTVVNAIHKATNER